MARQGRVEVLPRPEAVAVNHRAAVELLGPVAVGARPPKEAAAVLGARVMAVGPATLMPEGLEAYGVEVYHRLREVLPQADIVILLRIQQERQDQNNFPSLREYARFFGLGDDAVNFLKPEAIIMHPGPINRGVEISDAVADARQSPRTVILDQVTNGIAVRMACLYLLATGGRE